MSKSAPWLALASDWHQSRMLAGLGSEHLLAWIGILCHVKSRGRGGVAAERPDLVAHDMRLGESTVTAVAAIAARDGAILARNGTWTLTNWAAYQDPAKRKQSRDAYDRDKPPKPSSSFSKTGPTTTSHPSPPPRDCGASAPLAAADAKPPDRGRRIAWAADAGWSGITPDDLGRWRAAYPSVEIHRELAAAHDWLVSHPTRRGKRNWSGFLSRWFARSHERPSGSNGQANGRKPRDLNAEIAEYEAAEQRRRAGAA